MTITLGTSLIDDKEKKEPTTITGSEAKTYTLEIENGKIVYEDLKPLICGVVERRDPTLDFYYEHDNIYSSDTKQHKERKCWVCEKALNYQEYTNQNCLHFNSIEDRNKLTDKDFNKLLKENNKQLKTQWESDIVEIACCHCFDILNILQNRNLSSIRYHTDNYKIYDMKGKTFRRNKSKDTLVQLTFNSIQYDISIKAFKNLVEKKFIDIEPYVLKELLGGSE